MLAAALLARRPLRAGALTASASQQLLAVAVHIRHCLLFHTGQRQSRRMHRRQQKHWTANNFTYFWVGSKLSNASIEPCH